MNWFKFKNFLDAYPNLTIEQQLNIIRQNGESSTMSRQNDVEYIYGKEMGDFNKSVRKLQDTQQC